MGIPVQDCLSCSSCQGVALPNKLLARFEDESASKKHKDEPPHEKKQGVRDIAPRTVELLVHLIKNQELGAHSAETVEKMLLRGNANRLDGCGHAASI